jgi:hypothetical protein
MLNKTKQIKLRPNCHLLEAGGEVVPQVRMAQTIPAHQSQQVKGQVRRWGCKLSDDGGFPGHRLYVIKGGV